MKIVANDVEIEDLLTRIEKRPKEARWLLWIVYLIDWRMVITTGRQATNINWQLTNRGPISAGSYERLKIWLETQPKKNAFSRLRSWVRGKIKGPTPPQHLFHSDVEAAISYINDRTHDMEDSRLITLVYSTWPIINAAYGVDTRSLADMLAHYRKNSPRNFQRAVEERPSA